MTPHDQELTRWGKIRYGLAAWLLGLTHPDHHHCSSLGRMHELVSMRFRVVAVGS